MMGKKQETKNGLNVLPNWTEDCARLEEGETLLLPPGVHHMGEESTAELFCAPSNNDYGNKKVLFPLLGKKRVTVDGGGSTLFLHGRVLPFAAENCDDLTIRNVRIAGGRPFYSQGKILEADRQHLTLEFYEGFPYRVERGALIMEGDGWEADLSRISSLTQEFDPATGAPGYDTSTFMMKIGRDVKRDPHMPAQVILLEAEQLEGRRVRLTGDIPYLYHPGYDLVITHERRDNPIFFFKNCRRVRLENVEITYGGAMGVIAQACEDVQLQHVAVKLAEDAPGLVSILADATHFVNCSGRVEILDCVFESMMDDGVNIHGIYTLVKEAYSPRRILVELQHYQQYYVNIYSPGDRLRITRGRTAETAALVQVRSAELLDDRTILLDLEEDCSVQPGDVVDNLTKTPEVRIARCRMGKNRPRSVLITTPRHSVVEDCTFYSSLYCIHICGDTSYWFESGPVEDLTIRGNRFVDWAYAWGSYAIAITPEFQPTTPAPFFHRHIVIENNLFQGFEQAFLKAQYTDDLVFRGNTYTSTDTYPTRGVKEAVLLEHCGKTTVEEVRNPAKAVRV